MPIFLILAAATGIAWWAHKNTTPREKPHDDVNAQRLKQYEHELEIAVNWNEDVEKVKRKYPELRSDGSWDPNYGAKVGITPTGMQDFMKQQAQHQARQADIARRQELRSGRATAQARTKRAIDIAAHASSATYAAELAQQQAAAAPAPIPPAPVPAPVPGSALSSIASQASSPAGLFDGDGGDDGGDDSGDDGNSNDDEEDEVNDENG